MITIISLLFLGLVISFISYKNMANTTNVHTDIKKPEAQKSPAKAYFDDCVEQYLKNKYPDMVGYKITSTIWPFMTITVYMSDGSKIGWEGHSKMILAGTGIYDSQAKKILDDEDKKAQEEKKKFFQEHIAKIIQMIDEGKSNEANSIDYPSKDFSSEEIEEIIGMLTNEGYQTLRKKGAIRVIVPQY